MPFDPLRHAKIIKPLKILNKCQKKWSVVVSDSRSALTPICRDFQPVQSVWHLQKKGVGVAKRCRGSRGLGFEAREERLGDVGRAFQRPVGA